MLLVRLPRANEPSAAPLSSASLLHESVSTGAIALTKPTHEHSPICDTPNRQKHHHHLAFLLLVLAASCSPLARASPPVDYFIYTSQLATAQAGAQNVTSILPSIASIYAPPASTQSDNLTAELSARRDQELARLADKVLALVRNQSHTHDNNRVDLASTQYAWNLMERQAELYMRNRVRALRPTIEELLAGARVSAPCSRSIMDWLDQLAELKLWSALMWNSWGQFPMAGILQSSYIDLGSYATCMSIDDNELIGAPQYCMLDFQPLVPTRPRFHSIFKQILGHANNQLNRGDFEDAHKQVDARHAAHEYASKHYRDHSSRESSKAAHRQGVLSSDSLNITLKAEPLIELAKIAHYFYYLNIRIGACLPSKCSLDDVQKLASAASERAVLQSTSVSCVKKEPIHVNNHQLVAIWVLTGLAAIAVLGTIVDLLGFKEDRQHSLALVNWMLTFSIWTNAKRLFDLGEANPKRALDSINGLRFFTMLWVIFGHSIIYLDYQSFNHFHSAVEKEISNVLLLPLLLTNFGVATFFVISGLLTTYVTWAYTKGDPRKFNTFAFMISRYIRLTPQLAIVILCFFILPLLGDGPMYRAVADKQAEVCYRNWAINLLYLQSYVNADEHCIDPSWWLSVEMTFHLVSALVLIVMINNPRRGMWVNFLVAAGFTVAGAVIHYTNGFAIQYLPSIPQRYEIRSEQTLLFFHRPYPHAAAYFIGMTLGYVLANKTVKKLTQSQLVLGWVVYAVGIAVPMWGTYHWNLGAPYTQLQATVYYNLCQILWPISIAWIIFTCSLGYGGIFDSILSARCFVPLGRITYMTYLSHSLIIYFYGARMTATVEPSLIFFTYLIIGNCVIAILLGILLTVVYEWPILNLQKQLFTYFTQPAVGGHSKSSSSLNGSHPRNSTREQVLDKKSKLN